MLLNNDSTFPQFLVKLELGGAPLYFAERGPMTITVSGSPVAFHGGMSGGDIIETADLFGSGPVLRDVPVEVTLPPSFDLVTALALPDAIYGGKATVYLYAGGSFEDADRFAFGTLTAPIFADPSDPQVLAFTVSRSVLDYGYTHRARERMDDTSFSAGGFHPDDSDLGRYYPIPIGHPGVWSESLTGYTRAYRAVRARVAVPAALGDYRFVVALGSVQATSAHVWADNLYGGTADLIELTDDNGILTTCLDMTTYTGSAVDAEVSPTYVALIGEGAPDSSGGSFSGLGDVVVWALSRSSLNAAGFIDWPRVLGNVEALNAMGRVDVAITDRIHPLDWLVSEVLAYFPVFVNDAGNGLYVDVWRYDFGASEADIVIDVAHPGYERRSAVAFSSSDNYSTISVNGLEAANGAYLLNTTLTGAPEEIAAGVASHPLLQRSFNLYGHQELDLSVRVVQDGATLARLASFYAYKYALPRAIVGYSIPWRKVAPRIGMTAIVTDPAAGLSAARGIVSGYRYADGELVISLSLLPR